MVGNLNVRRPCIGPNEADPELIVDTDAVLSRSIAYQCFEAITRWRFQVLKQSRGLEHRKLASRDFAYRTETLRFLGLEKLFGVLAFEALNCHICIIYRFPVSGKFYITCPHAERYASMARRQAVTITNHGRAELVVLDAEEYKRLRLLDSRVAMPIEALSEADLDRLEQSKISDETKKLDHPVPEKW
jgi:PHD/YefM family antitoxin component YafN of YafNO toxin-antitoxin module